MSDLGGDASTTDVTASDVAVGDDARFCATYADAGELVYCEDFDAPDGAITLGNFMLSGGGTLVVDDTDFTSPPASLLTTIPPIDGGNARAYGSHSIAAAPSQVTLDFDMKVLSAGGAFANIAQFELGSPAYQLILQLTPEGGDLQEGTPTGPEGGTTYNSHPLVGFAWGSSWHHLRVVLDVKNKTTTLAIDGTNYEANRSINASWVTGLFNVSIGLHYDDPPAGVWQVRADSVLVQLSL